jgi:hypothetical protein
VGEVRGFTEICTYNYEILSEDKIIQLISQNKLPDVINLEMEEIPFVKVSWETDEMFEERKNNGDKILKLKTKSTLEGEVIEIKI